MPAFPVSIPMVRRAEGKAKKEPVGSCIITPASKLTSQASSPSSKKPNLKLFDWASQYIRAHQRHK